MARRYLPNPRRSDTPLVVPDGPRPRSFHRRLPGYAPTRLVDAAPVAAALDVGRVWVKDESSRLGLPAFKMLGASWATYRAVVDRLGEDPEPWADVEELAATLAPLRPFRLAAATDGNHGRAVARMAKLLGFGCDIFMPDGSSSARVAAIESEGASCTVLPGATYEDAVDRAKEEAGPDCIVVSDTSWPGYEEIPRWVIDGYSTIFEEVDEQLESRGAPPVDVVVIQSGVGALASATASFYRARPGRQPWLLNVEPVDAACLLVSVEAGERTLVPGPHRSIMAGLNCGLPSMLAFPTVAAGFDAFVSVTDDDARRAMRELADVCVVAGETGAAGLAGLDVVAERAAEWGAPLGPDTNVLVLCTEGATDPAAYREIVGAEPVACARARAGGEPCPEGTCARLGVITGA